MKTIFRIKFRFSGNDETFTSWSALAAHDHSDDCRQATEPGFLSALFERIMTARRHPLGTLELVHMFRSV